MKKKLNFDSPACSDLPTHVMFPGRNKNDAMEAKRLCASCEYQQECLLGAIRSDEMHGVWGGVNFENPRERRNAKKAYAGDRARYK